MLLLLAGLALAEEPLDAGLILVDPLVEAGEREEAALALARMGGAEAVELLQAGLYSRVPGVPKAALLGLSEIGDTRALGVLAEAVLSRHARVPAGLRLAAISAIERAATDEAGEVLLALAGEDELSRELKRAAWEALERGWPELTEGQSLATSTGAGVVFASAGGALTSGVLLSGVGVLSLDDTATVIGALGGAGIGAGSGVLVGMTRPVNTAQGTRFFSSSAWGVGFGTGVGEFAWYNSRDWDRSARGRAMVRSLGAAAGSTQGALTARYQPTDTGDVWENNLGGYLGAQIGLGSALMLTDGVRRDTTRETLLLTMGGAAVGLGASTALRRPWDPRGQDLVFGGLIGGGSAWLGGWMPYALDMDRRDGTVLLASHAGATVGLAAAQLFQPSWKQDAGLAWGMVLGNAAGAGLGFWASPNDGRPASRAMLVSGLLGGAAGALSAERTRFTPGDLAMVGLGTPMLTAQVGGYGVVLYDRDILRDPNQMGGVALSGFAASGAGLTGLSQLIDPDAGDMMALSAAGLWGAWYGVLTPVALKMDGRPSDLLLVTLVSSDAAMLAMGGAVYGLGLEPRRTVVPQLGGLTGATLGSLTASLISPQAEQIAGGAVIGSALGLAGGAAVDAGLRERRGAVAFRPILPRGRLDLPGQWMASAAPMPIEGDNGVYAQITWVETE